MHAQRGTMVWRHMHYVLLKSTIFEPGTYAVSPHVSNHLATQAGREGVMKKRSSYINTHYKKATQTGIEPWTSRSRQWVLIHQTTPNTLQGHVQYCMSQQHEVERQGKANNSTTPRTALLFREKKKSCPGLPTELPGQLSW